MPSDDKDLCRWIGEKEKHLEKREIEYRNKTLAVMFLKKVNQRQYGELVNSLHNQHTRVASQYPEDLASAYTMVHQFKPEKTVNQSRNASELGASSQLQPRYAGTPHDDIVGAQCLQDREPVAGTDGQIHPGITCYNCDEPGHYSGDCP